jgi:hypothetical protein
VAKEEKSHTWEEKCYLLASCRPQKVYLPLLHIKLGLIKNFVKVMDHDGQGFLYLQRKFPRISDAKIKEGIFIGPQIRELMKDQDFEGS